MYARMLPSSLERAVWIASPDTFVELATMALTVGTGGSAVWLTDGTGAPRSEEHTSELQSLMRISYAVFCLKKKTTHIINYRQLEQTTKDKQTQLIHKIRH